MEDRDWFVQELISRLVEEEFVVCLNTSSTGSSYLELDIGLGIRIRVSNHSIRKVTSAYVSVQPDLRSNNKYVRYVVRLSKSQDAVSEVVSIASEFRRRIWMKIGYGRYKQFLSNTGKSEFFVSDTVLSTYELFGKRLYQKELNSRIREYRKKNVSTASKIFCAM